MTDISENGIEAAFEHGVTQQTQAYQFKQGPDGAWLFKCNDWINLTAVLAYLPFHPPASREEGLKVKPLEWKEHAGGWIAYAIFGPYRVQFDGANWHTHFAEKAIGDGPWPTAAEAKDAAQADYEQRILSALIPTKPEAGEE